MGGLFIQPLGLLATGVLRALLHNSRSHVGIGGTCVGLGMCLCEKKSKESTERCVMHRGDDLSVL